MSRRSAPCYVVRIGSAGRYIGFGVASSMGWGHMLYLDKVDRQRDAIRFPRKVARQVAKDIDPIDARVVRLVKTVRGGS